MAFINMTLEVLYRDRHNKNTIYDIIKKKSK